jgi:hypothetical protein
LISGVDHHLFDIFIKMYQEREEMFDTAYEEANSGKKGCRS